MSHLTTPTPTPSPAPDLPTAKIPSLFTITTFRQHDPSDPSSDPQIVYTLRPQNIWKSLSRMREVIVDDQAYQHNDRVYINPSSLDNSSITASTSTPPSSSSNTNVNVSTIIGHILEIRAKNPQHVYLRVYLMRPAKGSNGNVAGEREWLTMDEMVVVNAAAVLGRAHIEYWDEDFMGEGEQGAWIEKV